MAADSWVLLAEKEHRRSMEARRKAEAHLERVLDAADRIRRMTEIYRERLEGKPQA